jgi:hypothetical protein
MIQLALFAGKVHEQTLGWSHSTTLWTGAYDIHPRSHHTVNNCGDQLSPKQEYARAERVM